MAIRVDISPAAARDLRRLPISVRDRLQPVILSLGNEPRPPGARKIGGAERAYRIRVGDYRVAHEVRDAAQVVIILAVGRRNESTYRGL